MPRRRSPRMKTICSLCSLWLLLGCTPSRDPYVATVFDSSEVRRGATYAGGGVKYGSSGQGISTVNMAGIGREGLWTTLGPQFRSESTVISLQSGIQVCRRLCHDRRSITGARLFADVWSDLAPKRALSAYVAYSQADAAFGTRWRLWFGSFDLRLGPEIQINDDRAAVGAAAAFPTGVLGMDAEISTGGVQARSEGLGPYVSVTFLRNFIIEPIALPAEVETDDAE